MVGVQYSRTSMVMLLPSFRAESVVGVNVYFTTAEGRCSAELFLSQRENDIYVAEGINSAR